MKKNVNSRQQLETERHSFEQDILTINTMPVTVGSDLGHPKGNISNDERMNGYLGDLMHNKLMQSYKIATCIIQETDWFCDNLSKLHHIES